MVVPAADGADGSTIRGGREVGEGNPMVAFTSSGSES